MNSDLSDSEIYSDKDDDEDDNDSVYDEGNENTAIQDIELGEMNRSIEDENNEVLVEYADVDDVHVYSAVEANREQKYVGLYAASNTTITIFAKIMRKNTFGNVKKDCIEFDWISAAIDQKTKKNAANTGKK